MNCSDVCVQIGLLKDRSYKYQSPSNAHLVEEDQPCSWSVYICILTLIASSSFLHLFMLLGHGRNFHPKGLILTHELHMYPHSQCTSQWHIYHSPTTTGMPGCAQMKLGTIPSYKYADSQDEGTGFEELLQYAVKCASSAVFSTWISHKHHRQHDNVTISGVLVAEKHQQIPPHTPVPCTLPGQPPWTLHCIPKGK